MPKFTSNRGVHLKKMPESLCIDLIQLLDEVFDEALMHTIDHQVEIPNSELAKSFREKSKRLRVFDPESNLPPISKDPDIAFSADNLPPEIFNTLKAAFSCCHDILVSRYIRDKEGGWGAQAKLGSARKAIQFEVAKGTIPKTIPLLLNIAESLAFSEKPVDLETLVQQHFQQGHNGPNV